jgi:hypothetical protein
MRATVTTHLSQGVGSQGARNEPIGDQHGGDITGCYFDSNNASHRFLYVP